MINVYSVCMVRSEPKPSYFQHDYSLSKIGARQVVMHIQQELGIYYKTW